MSATNRGTVRAAFDTYETPTWCTRRLLERWCPVNVRTILEPCAADGAIVRVLRERYPVAARIIATDVRPEATLGGDAANERFAGVDVLAQGCEWDRVDLCVTNPPFRHADAFIERALASADLGVAMLLPFQRLADGHSEFFARVGLPYLYVLPDRPSFVATTRCEAKCGWQAFHKPTDPTRIRVCPVCGAATKRGTQDVNCYAWFTWGVRGGRADARGGYEYLARTSAAERKLG